MPFPFPFTLFGANRSSNTPSTSSCDTYCYGGDWVQGKVGRYGLSFPGGSSNARVIVPTDASIELGDSDDFTVACWVKSADASNYPGFVSKYWTDGAGDYKGWMLGHWYTSTTPTEGTTPFTNKMFFQISDGVANDRGFAWTDNAITDGEWHYLVGVRDGTTKLASLYLDGVLQSDTSTRAMADSTDELLLGQYYNYTLTSCLDGKLDEAALWNVALTPAQISLLSTGSARADSITPPVASDGAWATGKVDSYALEFPVSSDDYVSIPLGATTGSSNGQSGSIAAWVYRDAAGSYPMIVNAAKNTGTGDYSYFAITSDSPAGRLTWVVRQGAAWIVSATSAATISLSTWTHVAVTCDGTNVKFYINATQSATTIALGSDGNWFADGDANTQSALLGNLLYDSAYNYPFSGKLDEIAIWTEPLNLGGIEALYNSGSGAKADTVSSSYLASYYDMEDGPGSLTLTDQTANGYDGTLTSMDGGTTGSLLLYYDFEIGDSQPGASNFPANDLVYDVDTASFHSPTAHTGTMTNMTQADFGSWKQGKVGKYSLDFGGNGTDDYVDLPAGAVSGSNSNATSGTMAAWIYPEANSNYEMMFSMGRPAANHYIYWSMSPTTNAPRLTHWNESVQKTYTSTIVVPLNQWSHVAVSSDDTDIYFYVNGTASAGTGDTGASWFGDLPSTATKTIIGSLWYSGTPQYEFNGKIDEFAIWTEPLDLGAIKELYADGVGAKANTVSSSVLVSYYDMECDGPGSTNLKDLSGNSYDGTLTNMSPGTCGEG